MVFLFILIAIFILIISLTIKIEIINFKFTSQTKRHINKNYKIAIKLLAFGKIPISNLNITKTKLEKLKLKEKIKDIDFKLIQDKNKLDKRVLQAIKEINMDIDFINLKIELGTENASLTSIIVPVISTFLAILLRKKVQELDNLIFNVNPIYINQNLINIEFSGIFEIKMIHIISIIYILSKKKGVDKYERTSNRRSYDYSYE